MANFNEHALEMSIMELFKDEGYTYVSGDQIHRERTEVLLTDDLKQFLMKHTEAKSISTKRLRLQSQVFRKPMALPSICTTLYQMQLM